MRQRGIYEHVQVRLGKRNSHTHTHAHTYKGSIPAVDSALTTTTLFAREQEFCLTPEQPATGPVLTFVKVMCVLHASILVCHQTLASSTLGISDGIIVLPTPLVNGWE